MEQEKKERSRVLSNSSIIVAAVVSALGLAWYQSIAVQGTGARNVDVGKVIRIDEVKELAAALIPKTTEVKEAELPRMPVGETGRLPLAGKRGTVEVPRSAPKRAKTGSASPKPASTARSSAAQPRRTESVFRKEASSISRELSRSFYKRTDFGFSGKVKKSSGEKRIRSANAKRS